jgi:hypothetical protein
MVMASFVLFAQIGSVHFSVSASPDTVYVRQQISYEASLSVRELSPPRFLASPEYTPSDIQGVEVYTFPFDTMRSVRHVTMDGVRFIRYTYRSAVFPLTAGVVTIPPSTLTYTLLDEADPYASESTTVHSAPQRVVILPLPLERRPADFSGAVGQFTITAAVDSQGLRTGHAFDLRVTVTGAGDIALLQRPALTIPWATVVSTSASVMWDFTDTLMRGSKEFRWLVTPQSGGNLTIPQTRYSYFDPKTKSYVITAAAAIPLTVAGDSVPPPRRDSLAATPFSKPMHTLRQRFMLLLGVLVLAGATVWGAVHRHRTHNP